MCDLCMLEDIHTSTRRVYRRPLTQLEERYGDVDRVHDDMQAAEERIAKIASPVLRRIAAQLAEEAERLAKTGDMSAIRGLKASYTAELATALKVGLAGAISLGRAQIADAHRAQMGTRMAARKKPPAKDPRKAAQYLSAKAGIDAERIGAQVEEQMRLATIAQVAKNTQRDFFDEALDAGGRALAGIARSEGREAIGVGRLLEYEEVKTDVSRVYYTAILDDRVCEVCAALDGTDHGPDEYGKTPNGDCLGEQHGNACRCFEVVVFKGAE